jgi:thiol-disulfide isomerase/thioredoxin
MRRKLFLALLIVGAAFISLPVAARRVPTTSAITFAPSSQKPRAKSLARSQVVREINLDGLKKLIERGGKQSRPLLVNFWATYCEPCREEFPDLVQINKDFQAKGLEFVTVSLDDPAEIKTSVPQFLKQMRAVMPAYLLNVPDPEPAIKWVDVAWNGGLPATYLYDAEGQVVFKHTGRIKPAELRAAIETVTK